MSNSLYQKGREKFLKGEIAWLDDNIKVALIKSTYTPDITNHEFFSSISSHILTGTTPIITLTGKTATNGTADADITTFIAITQNQTISYVILFKDPDVANTNGEPAIGNVGTSPLICMFDSGYGIGAGTNNGDIQITWDINNGIFRL